MAFGAYLNYVSNTVNDQLTDLRGTEITAMSIKHNGILVPFQYQLWRIKEPSVCDSYELNIQDYSNCTIAAKKLFNNLCIGLQKKLKTSWRYKKIKNMYCRASISYKPTIARITKASFQTDLVLARKNCNIATAKAIGSNKKNLDLARVEACDIYKELKTAR